MLRVRINSSSFGICNVKYLINPIPTISCHRIYLGWSGGGGGPALLIAFSRPRDSLSISAPNWCRADMVEGVGSVSGSHSSCVSSVVKSVSVDEWWCV